MSVVEVMDDPNAWDRWPSAAEHDEGVVASAGSTLAAGMPVATVSAVIEALRTVHDPEIPVNIYDLGLVYGLHIEPTGDVAIEMTLTTPGCPVAGQMPTEVAETVAAVPGVGVVEVALVWEPAWTKDCMSEDARLALGFL
ncbi:MAG: iron-sulfur cluster assembly protein [Defluviicoccus sp.]